MRRQFLVLFSLLSCYFILFGTSIAQVILSEIMFNPTGSEYQNEFVEIFNLSTSETVDLGGWRIADNAGTDEIIAVSSGLSLMPQQFGIILDPDYFGNSNLYDHLIPSSALVLTISGSTFGSGGFSNSQAETVYLINASNDTIASHQYSVPNQDGYSEEKIVMTTDDTPENWQDSKRQYGTPGAKNSVTPSQYDISINAEDISFTPQKPRYTNPVSVTALVRNLGMIAIDSVHIGIFEDANSDSALDEDELLATQTVSHLAASDSLSMSWQIGSLAAGYHLIAIELSLNDDDITDNVAFKRLAVGYLEHELVVNEIMYRPSSGDPEWIEVYNRSSSSIDLANWWLSDSRSSSAVEIAGYSIILPSQEYAIIAEDSSFFETYPDIVSPVLTPRKGFPALNNSGDAVVIKDLTVSTIDSVFYQSSWGGESGVSMERKRPKNDSNNPKNWGTCKNILGSTPGQRNSISPKRFDLGFGYHGFKVEPPAPSKGEEIKITVWIHNFGEDEASNFSITLFELDGLDSLARTGTPISTQYPQFPLIAEDSLAIEFIWENVLGGRHYLLARLDWYADLDSTNNYLLGFFDTAFVPHSLVINEIMYRPLSGEPEWIELFNLSDESVDLQNWRLRDNLLLRPTLITEQPHELSAGAYCVVSADGALWPDSVDVIIAPNFPMLNNDRDELVLFDPSATVIDSVAYVHTWGGALGTSLEKKWSERGNADSTNWGSSKSTAGSTPGYFNSISPLEFDVAIIDSSILFYPASPNPGERVAVHATITNVGRQQAKGISVRFFLDSMPDLNIGQTVTISELESEISIPVSVFWESPPSGSHRICVQVRFDEDQSPADNQACTEIAVGFQPNALVINEIMYSPLPDQPEWIELANPSDNKVNLRHWQISDSDTSTRITICDTSNFIPAGGFLVVAKDSSLLDRFNRIPSLVIFKKSLPSLNNDFDEIVLFDPIAQIIDRVDYNDDWGGDLGISLERISLTVSSQEPSNWSSSVAVAGGTPGDKNSIFTENLPSETSMSFSPNPFSPDGDGFEDFTILQLKLPSKTARINLKIYDVLGRLVRYLCNNEPTGSERAVVWDGMADDGRKCRMGIYIVYLEAFDASQGMLQTAKKTVVLAGQL